jgi:hypothetical protein
LVDEVEVLEGEVEIHESGRSYEIHIKLPPGYRPVDVHEISSDEETGDILIGVEVEKVR